MENVYIMLFCFLAIGVAVIALVGALIIQLATRWVASFKPSYRDAYLAAFLGYFGAILVSIVLFITIGMSSDSTLEGTTANRGIQFLVIVVYTVFQIVIYSLLLKHPETGKIGFTKGFLVFLIQLIPSSVMLGFWGAILRAMA
jgi:hypothetical protein